MSVRPMVCLLVRYANVEIKRICSLMKVIRIHQGAHIGFALLRHVRNTGVVYSFFNFQLTSPTAQTEHGSKT